MAGKLINNIVRMLTICAILVLSVSFIQMEAKASTKSVYRGYVNQHFNAKKHPNLKCQLYDINKDGTKEMIAEYESGVRCAYQIFTCKKGKVKKLHKGEFSGAGALYRIKGKKELVISFSNGAADNEYGCYKIKGGKLKKVRSYRSVFDMGTESVAYFRGKKEISSGDYESFCEKLKGIQGKYFIQKYKRNLGI